LGVGGSDVSEDHHPNISCQSALSQQAHEKFATNFGQISLLATRRFMGNRETRKRNRFWMLIHSEIGLWANLFRGCVFIPFERVAFSHFATCRRIALSRFYSRFVAQGYTDRWRHSRRELDDSFPVELVRPMSLSCELSVRVSRSESAVSAFITHPIIKVASCLVSVVA